MSRLDADRREPQRRCKPLQCSTGCHRFAAATAGRADDCTRCSPDRGYDHDKYRRLVWSRGIKPIIARRQTNHAPVRARLERAAFEELNSVCAATRPAREGARTSRCARSGIATSCGRRSARSCVTLSRCPSGRSRRDEWERLRRLPLAFECRQAERGAGRREAQARGGKSERRCEAVCSRRRAPAQNCQAHHHLSAPIGGAAQRFCC